ncbi:hypothetical protein LSH36_890g00021 [Paralvinella palmiformis]|uniref:G-protein coupled receptors family 1 profile domain-containing protein n=1 Tax=Paralvinella palmiformis TaxID=53620 RepID=A0AAD9IXV5_9ANNE|nr:hypothetical protein LSH36_890g00021 [Paralvinella palmiformis]
MTSAEAATEFIRTTVEPQPDSTMRSIYEDVLKIVTIFIGVLGFTGNTFIVIVMSSCHSVRVQVTNIYLINQGIVDALASLFLTSFTLTSSDGTGLSESYNDQLLCRLWLTRFPVWGTVMSSTYSLLVLTIDRYCRIVHPFMYKKYFSKRILAVMITFAWLVGPLYNIAWVWPTSVVLNGQCLAFSQWPSIRTAQMVGITMAGLQYFFPLFTFVYCYSRIIAVIRSRVKVAPQPTQLSNQSFRVRATNFRQAMKNTIKTLILVAASFVVCWTVNEMLILMYFLGYPVDFSGTCYQVSVVAVFSNSCINPIIYLAHYDDFRYALRQLFYKSRVVKLSTSNQDTVGRY